METQIFDFKDKIDQEKLEFAANLLRQGELVAFPTETVYGLGAHAFNEKAVANIFKVKGRPQDNPLTVHLSNLVDLEKIAVDIPAVAYQILDHFAPGPITVVLRKSDLVPGVVSAGLNTVGVRFPSNNIARALIKAAAVPLVAPSANLSGKPSPTKAWHVYDDLAGKIPCIIDGGASQLGLESTILDLSGSEPKILRPGLISPLDIKQKTGISVKNICKLSKAVEISHTPSQKYKHYSPEAKIILLEQNVDQEKRMTNLFQGLQTILLEQDENQRKEIEQIIIAFYIPEDLAKRIKKINLLKKLEENLKEINLIFILETYNNNDNLTEATNHLFDRFREFDRKRVDYIVCTAEPPKGKGLAYMNRLEKATKFRI